ncbi:MAG: RNA-binding domain-containing protein [Candidatus Cyclobacteriaceae bacterium M2_1C_046]
MALRVPINELINPNTIESYRKEFKRGWNPLSVLKTVCAFANDINEEGGGYIIIGIEEIDGIPQLPPWGIPQNDLDGIQQDFFRLCQNDLKEPYFPPITPVQVDDKWVLIIDVNPGEQRPYEASTSHSRNSPKSIFVRHGSVTKIATLQQIEELRELSKKRYFDDRINQDASMNDLDLGLIRTYLQRTVSSLFGESSNLPFQDLCQQLGLVRGPVERIRPVNFALLLFSLNPEVYFTGCKTGLVVFKDDLGGDIDYSKEFTGSLPVQIQEILEFLKTNIIKEKITKPSDQAESETFYNYPFNALEEAIVNSLFHRDFENPEPNQIRIFPNGPDRRIEISSFPGPISPIDQDALMQDRVPPRNRNIKLGDWLKTLKLTEKFGSGIPKIRKSMNTNGSPRPEFITDDEKTHFMVILRIHPDWPAEDGSVNEMDRIQEILTNMEQLILEMCLGNPTKNELLNHFHQKIPKQELIKTIASLVDRGYLIEKRSKYMFGMFSMSVYFVTNTGNSILQNSF